MSATLGRIVLALAVLTALPLQGMAQLGADPCESAHHDAVPAVHDHEDCCSSGSICSAWPPSVTVAPQAAADRALLPAPSELRSARLYRPPLNS